MEVNSQTTQLLTPRPFYQFSLGLLDHCLKPLKYVSTSNLGVNSWVTPIGVRFLEGGKSHKEHSKLI